jgi:hypothetical protein
MPPLKTPSLPAWSWIFVAIGFLFALVLGLQVRRNQHGVDDFNQFYTGATLVRTGHLYEMPAVLAQQRATVGVERPDISPSRLGFYYWLLIPLSRLPYATAYGTWSAIVIAAAVLFPLVYPAADRAALFAAGAVSLLAIKFHLFFLLPIPFLLRRESRVLAGAATGGGILAAVSFAVAGDWVPKYVRLISDTAVITGTINKPNLHGVLAGLAGSGVSEVVLSLVVIGVTLFAARNATFEISLAAAMLGSFLLSRHAFLHDCAILLPAHTYLAWRVRAVWTRAFAIALLTPFPYFLPPLMFEVRHGLAAAVLIAGTLGSSAVLKERAS